MNKVTPSEQVSKEIKRILAGQIAANDTLLDSLKKTCIEENGEATFVSHTSNNDFFKGKTETFSVTRFLLKLPQNSTA